MKQAWEPIRWCGLMLIGGAACAGDARPPAQATASRTATVAPGAARSSAATQSQAPSTPTAPPSWEIVAEERRAEARLRAIARDPWRTPPEVATSQPRPCVFAGTLRLEYDALFSDAAAKHPVLKAVRLDLSALTLPPTVGGAVRVDTVWPLRATFWLPPTFLPLQLASPQDLVPRHIWLPAATTVRAGAPQGENARVQRPTATPGHRKSSPAFNDLLPCSELALTGQLGPSDGEEPPDSARFMGRVQLSAQPNEPPIGTLELPISTELGVLERDGPWTHVTGLPDDYRDGSTSYVPYAFDAWTKSKPVDSYREGSGGFWFASKPTHITTAELRLLKQPAPGDTFAILPVDVVIGVGLARDGFVPVVLPGVYPIAELTKLWVAEAEANGGTRPLEP